MTILVKYASKKELKGEIGKPLRYRKTSIFGPEFKRNGSFVVANRPMVTNWPGREFFAEVTMKDGLITKVE